MCKRKSVSGKILLIEDDYGVRESLADMLEMNGFEVLQADNGLTGIRMLENHVPDIVVSDIMMPIMSGFDVLRKAKSNPKTELTPVLLLTAKVDLESKLRGLEYGANDYLTKPFEYRELLLKITNTLNLYSKLKVQAIEDTKSVEHTSSNDVFINKVHLLLEEYLQKQDLKMDDIADKLHMSPSTLQRKIKKITGLSPIKYINEYRLKKAKSMIKINYGNLSEIAEKTGFGSISYFSTSYKNFFGNNPKSDFPE